MLSPTPQYRVGWGNTKGFDTTFDSEGGTFELIKLL